MIFSPSKHLSETEWLASRLSAPDISIVDATWYLPGDERDAYKGYLDAHIPGAIFFDIDKMSDPNTDLPHMLPSPIQFASQMRKLGLGDGQHIIVYDQHGLYSAARVWWTLRTMGHQDVSVLNGGLPKWQREDREVEDGPSTVTKERHFTARLNRNLVRDYDNMLSLVQQKQNSATTEPAQIVDTRPAARFSGKAEEPRPGLKCGHMPGAINIPYDQLTTSDGQMHSPEVLKDLFAGAGLNLQKPIVTSCGSGITASIAALALAVAGHKQTAVYDGSWAEWGSKEEAQVVGGV